MTLGGGRTNFPVIGFPHLVIIFIRTAFVISLFQTDMLRKYICLQISEQYPHTSRLLLYILAFSVLRKNGTVKVSRS
jgi:hypothetical protein